ncbi:hypothetical protein DPMN_099052 [Dreissena polymorpha]|uniref:Uncharacterized protein n=1 Tax=Dreissena polymorpha TaxID=45954 RepID=A0A9D4LES8_DREPO|nr:hypothetical protein DPMN_099052 [Dreissena polymorpha]
MRFLPSSRNSGHLAGARDVTRQRSYNNTGTLSSGNHDDLFIHTTRVRNQMKGIFIYCNTL